MRGMKADRSVDCAEAENEQAPAAVNARAVGAMKPGVKAKKAEVRLPERSAGQGLQRLWTTHDAASLGRESRSASLDVDGCHERSEPRAAQGCHPRRPLSGVLGFRCGRFPGREGDVGKTSWRGKRPIPFQGDTYLACASTDVNMFLSRTLKRQSRLHTRYSFVV